MFRAQTNGEPVDGVRYDSIIAHERAATETARRDLDQCRMKLETVSYEVSDRVIWLFSYHRKNLFGCSSFEKPQ